jgi:NitT/TauT family transport system permease protein
VISFRRFFLKEPKAHEEVSSAGLGRQRVGFGIAGTVAMVILWALIGDFLSHRPGYEQFRGFSPLPAASAFLTLLTENHFWASVMASLCRVVVGIMLAFVVGLPFGLLIGFYRKLHYAVDPSIQFLRMVSPLAWMPIALLVFASFEYAIHFLIAIASVWPILLNTTTGVARVNPQWINMARDQGATDYHLITRIMIPASIPYILTSLRLALGVAWIVLVPAEFLGVSSGLGYLINDARDTMEYDRLMAVVMAIGLLGFVLDGTIQLVQKRLKWNWAS